MKKDLSTYRSCTIDEVIGFPGYLVYDIKSDRHNYNIFVSKGNPPEICSICHSSRIIDIKGAEPYKRIVKYLSCLALKTWVNFSGKYYFCQECKTSFHENCDDIAPKYNMAARLYEFLIGMELFGCKGIRLI